MALVVRCLGDLLAERDGHRCDVGGPKPRTLLALLCTADGVPMPAHALITEVWGEAPSARTHRALESQIWRLRKALTPMGGDSPISTESTGYRLDPRIVSVDAAAFLRAAAHADGLSTTDLESMLAQWRGVPLHGVLDAPRIDEFRTTLQMARAILLRARAKALLAQGDHGRALDESLALIDADPLDESAWALKMTALVAAGRRAEALASYRDVRTLLATELGIEPGADLRRIQRDVLRAHTDRARRMRVPLNSTSFVGRSREIDVVGELLADHRVVTLTGLPGVGKTRLAVEAARRIAERYDDGVWFVPASGDDDAVQRIVAALQLTPGSDPSTTLIAFLSQLNALLVLDGLPHPSGAAVVDMIVAQCAEVSVLATDTSLGDEPILKVEPLSSGPAIQLLVDRIRSVVGYFDPKPHDAALQTICAAMGGLPLGLELAAARAAAFSTAEVAEQVRAETPEPISRAFDLAIDGLDPELRVAFRAIAVLDGPFTAPAARAVTSRADIAGDLTELARRALLTPVRADRHRVTRFVILNALRHRARRETALDLVTARCDDYVESLLTAAPSVGSSGYAAWLARVDADHATMMASLRRWVDDPQMLRVHGDQLGILGTYWFLRRRLSDGLVLLERAHTTAVANGIDGRTRSIIDTAYGVALAYAQQMPRARPLLLDVIGRDVVYTGDSAAEVTDRLTHIAMAVWTGDDHELAYTLAQAAYDRVHDTASGSLAVIVGVLGLSELTVGHLRDAVAHAQEALAAGTSQGSDMAVFLAATVLGIQAALTPEPAMGLRWTERAAGAFLAAGGIQLCDVIEQRGTHYANAGSIEAAGVAFGASRRFAADAGLDWPRSPLTDASTTKCASADATAFQKGCIRGAELADDALNSGDLTAFVSL